MTAESWESMVTVGRVVRPHGNRGEVVIAPETDFGAERFRAGERLQTIRDERIEQLTVRSSRPHDGRWVVGFDGVATIDQAEALRGLELRIPGSAVATLSPDRHYVHDLVGCRVETVEHETVGTVVEVHFGAGTPLLVVNGARGEVLVPFADEVCKRVDTAARTIVIAPPEGLVDLNTP
jgi:16S rRNA processing protein RimM